MTVLDGPQNVDLNILTHVVGTGSAGVIKDGTGTLFWGWDRSNTYPGATIVRRGRLELRFINGLTAVAGRLEIGGGQGPATLDVIRDQNGGRKRDCRHVRRDRRSGWYAAREK